MYYKRNPELSGWKKYGYSVKILPESVVSAVRLPIRHGKSGSIHRLCCGSRSDWADTADTWESITERYTRLFPVCRLSAADPWHLNKLCGCCLPWILNQLRIDSGDTESKRRKNRPKTYRQQCRKVTNEIRSTWKYPHRCGKLTAAIPKATNGGANQYGAKSTSMSNEQKPKSEALREIGIQQKQAERYERLAKYLKLFTLNRLQFPGAVFRKPEPMHRARCIHRRSDTPEHDSTYQMYMLLRAWDSYIYCSCSSVCVSDNCYMCLLSSVIISLCCIFCGWLLCACWWITMLIWLYCIRCVAVLLYCVCIIKIIICCIIWYIDVRDMIMVYCST